MLEPNAGVLTTIWRAEDLMLNRRSYLFWDYLLRWLCEIDGKHMVPARDRVGLPLEDLQSSTILCLNAFTQKPTLKKKRKASNLLEKERSMPFNNGRLKPQQQALLLAFQFQKLTKNFSNSQSFLAVSKSIWITGRSEECCLERRKKKQTKKKTLVTLCTLRDAIHLEALGTFCTVFWEEAKT